MVRRCGWLPILLIVVEGVIFGLLDNPIDLSLVPGSLAAYIPTLAFLTLIAGLGEEPGCRRRGACPRKEKPVLWRSRVRSRSDAALRASF